ncbi:GntR family transcriptional regulator/MocR family aminotransferase [Dyadobacter jejuensis]|uniref:GntR family transcriptional regulator/MocR family aminotransferase n=1 Tax=Dyadobacter jejuensis TaxID=1082580 RepID=A0A316APW3_9BACT|nr:PLP-dependent aminotransferase family protein [Dyadobacter jejuensis]PWJ59528.1 GntR family transcriptional regulator/MocR family aminotransferase [Dyadobacter jejuensis]
MSSPVEVALNNLIKIDRSLSSPVYLQIAKQMINAIQRGVLRHGVRLPGSRQLALGLGVHRKTAIAAIAELEAQGWVTVSANRGTFVHSVHAGPADQPVAFDSAELLRYPKEAGFGFRRSMLLDRPVSLSRYELEFTDGLPDVRLAPMDRLSKNYAGILRRGNSRGYLGYSHVEGNTFFRQHLANYLNDTRGLHVGVENILTTRGIQMGLYLASTTLLEPGDRVVVGSLSYYVANMIFQKAGAQLSVVPVDEQGVSLEAIRDLCRGGRIRMLYITPHHHYPTTVTLSAERRQALIQLSVEYGFVILEDDYDYDYHYHSSPVLPLASADRSGMVVYIGSFCKALAPGLRTGYIVAPENLIAEIGKLRRIVDRQGDMVMEQALAEMIREGEFQRHLKKAQKIYQERRDALCMRLAQEFEEYLTFQKPPGGLAVWTEWRRDLNLLKLSRACAESKLHLPQTLLFQSGQVSGIRLGFGNFNLPELHMATDILRDSVAKVSG